MRDRFKELNEKKPIANTLAEEELRQILDGIWENRFNVTDLDTLKYLKRYAHKKYLQPLNQVRVF